MWAGVRVSGREASDIIWVQGCGREIGRCSLRKASDWKDGPYLEATAAPAVPLVEDLAEILRCLSGADDGRMELHLGRKG